MRHTIAKLTLLLAAIAALPSCAAIVPGPQSASEPAADTAQQSVIETALQAGFSAGPNVASFILSQDDARSALASFIESCPKLLIRDDASGLTQKADWQPACDAAASWRADDPRGFFESNFEAVRIGDGAAFATGYFEPEIAGCRTRQPDCEVPVYAVPSDLVRAWPVDTPVEQREGQPPLGRFNDAGDHVPYFERGEIEDGALDGRGLEFAWAADPVAMFFLQIQGSGRLRTADGDVIRIGYAGQNGREYVAIGRVMREQGLLGDGPGQYAPSMQGIVQYLRDYPEEGRALMRVNKSWIFFRELTGDGPLGALGIPVRRESSVAVDPRFVPLGAPVWLDLDRSEADGLWIAQDTGGAIKGANRFDTFWGAGDDAKDIAGSMSSLGQAVLLLPKGALERLGGQP